MYYNSNLNFLMKMNSLNKNQLSLILKVSRQNIQQLVTTQDPKASTLIKLSQIFNVSIDDLLLKDLENEK